MTEQEELELKNIVAGLLCISHPEAIRKMHEAYNEISCSICDILAENHIPDDISVEITLGNVLMHLMRNGMVEKLHDKNKDEIDG